MLQETSYRNSLSLISKVVVFLCLTHVFISRKKETSKPLLDNDVSIFLCLNLSKESIQVLLEKNKNKYVLNKLNVCVYIHTYIYIYIYIYDKFKCRLKFSSKICNFLYQAMFRFSNFTQ